MKRRLLGLIVGLLLIGFNGFAADGDLIVNGKLEVNGGGLFTPGIQLDRSGDNSYILFSRDGSSLAQLRASGTSGIGITPGGGGTHKLFVDVTTGNVGINTTSPAARLEINGTTANTLRISLSGYPNNNWDIFNNASGDGSFVYMYNAGVKAKVLTDGTWSKISDISLKDNISPLEHPMDSIKLINGVQFTWKDKDNFPQGWQIGVLAQEVEKVLPEAASTNEDGNKMISYDNLIPLLIEAVKEQQKSIEDLQAQVKKLSSQ